MESDNPDEALDAIQKMVSGRSTGWKYALYTFLEARGFNPGVIAQVEDLLESSRTCSGKVFLSPTHRLLITRDSFILEPVPEADGRSIDKSERACAASDASAVEDEIIILSPGVYTIGAQKLTVELFDRPEDFPLRQPEGVTAIDADRANFPLKVRRWQDGDWMRPLGCRGRKKMSDLFTDLKFNAPQKRSALLLADGSRVFALIGRRIDESVKITPATTRVLRLTLH